MERQFYVAGYVGEGARSMLLDLSQMKNMVLLDKVIANKPVRVLYYRISAWTKQFERFAFLKKLFYPWYTVLQIKPCPEKENCILFFNSGFCRELDLTVIQRLKKRDPKAKLILYMVDPMVGFDSEEHWQVIKQMDHVYSINKADCEKYGFLYYPLIYSVGGEAVCASEEAKTDLYYLGSGNDRDEALSCIYKKCGKAGITTDFHVLGEENRKCAGITFHQEPLSYEENLLHLLKARAILEVMHKDFDNPTQRYCEAVVYNKRLLTNNGRTKSFAFYDPRYMQVFEKMEDLDLDFLTQQEKADYGYQGEFSPCLFIQEINSRLDAPGERE